MDECVIQIHIFTMCVCVCVSMFIHAGMWGICMWGPMFILFWHRLCGLMTLSYYVNLRCESFSVIRNTGCTGAPHPPPISPSDLPLLCLFISCFGVHHLTLSCLLWTICTSCTVCNVVSDAERLPKPAVVVVAFLSCRLWGSPGMCTHTCTRTGTLHRVRGLRARPFSVTPPCRQPHSIFRENQNQ